MAKREGGDAADAQEEMLSADCNALDKAHDLLSFLIRYNGTVTPADDPFPSRAEMLQRIAVERARTLDRIILRLLSHWVSELEPSVVMRGDTVLGLAWADDPQQRIVVPNVWSLPAVLWRYQGQLS